MSSDLNVKKALEFPMDKVYNKSDVIFCDEKPKRCKMREGYEHYQAGVGRL